MLLLFPLSTSAFRIEGFNYNLQPSCLRILGWILQVSLICGVTDKCRVCIVIMYTYTSFACTASTKPLRLIAGRISWSNSFLPSAFVQFDSVSAFMSEEHQQQFQSKFGWVAGRTNIHLYKLGSGGFRWQGNNRVFPLDPCLPTAYL